MGASRFGISNVYIDSILNDRLHVPGFLGVFSSDTLPIEHARSNKNFSLVCNLSRESENGSHFISIVRRDGCVMYLDSLAVNATLNNDIQRFLMQCQSTVHLLKLTKPIQHRGSVFCGFYAMFFVMYFSLDCSTMVQCKPFGRNLVENDEICVDNIKRLINVYV